LIDYLFGTLIYFTGWSASKL